MPSLVIKRKEEQRVIVEIPGFAPMVITVAQVGGYGCGYKVVKLIFDAPLEVRILREELLEEAEA